jgi:hypothetical protein
MITTPGRSTVGISFHPKPTHPVVVPCPVTARGSVIGELVEYNSQTGRGKAALDNNTSVALLPFLEIEGYTYLNFTLEPDVTQRNAMPDEKRLDEILSKMATDIEIDYAVNFVLKGMGNPPEGGMRDAIIAHVRQWHTIHNSP